jgi:hypothetical protein
MGDGRKEMEVRRWKMGDGDGRRKMEEEIKDRRKQKGDNRTWKKRDGKKICECVPPG